MKKIYILVVSIVMFLSISFLPQSHANASEIGITPSVVTHSEEVTYEELEPSIQKELGEPTEDNQIYTIVNFYVNNENQTRAIDAPVGTFVSTIKTDDDNNRKKTVNWTASSAYHGFDFLNFSLNTGASTYTWTSQGQGKFSVSGSKTWTYKEGGIYKVSISSQAYFYGASAATLSSIPSIIIVL